MGWKHWCVCEVESYFDDEFDGSLYKVKRVVQAFATKEEANRVCSLMDPMLYGDDDTILRVVEDSELQEAFR